MKKFGFYAAALAFCVLLVGVVAVSSPIEADAMDTLGHSNAHIRTGSVPIDLIEGETVEYQFWSVDSSGDITGSDTVPASGGYIKAEVDGGKITLTLNNVKVNPGVPFALDMGNANVELRLVGDNILNSTDYWPAIYVTSDSAQAGESNLTITGDGSLTCLGEGSVNDSTANGYVGAAVYAQHDLAVTGSLSATGGAAAGERACSAGIYFSGPDSNETAAGFTVGEAGAVTATPDAGYELAYITVDGERIPGTSFTMPAHDVTVSAVFTRGEGFADVAPGSWYYDAVEFVRARGLMDGVSETEFAPDATMTRAMVWAILGRHDGEEISGSGWLEAARAWALESGVSDGTEPNAAVTREQLVTMLYRFAGESATAADLNGYADGGAVSDWARNAFAWAIEHIIITGVDDDTLAPKSTATRAQCAAILMRFTQI